MNKFRVLDLFSGIGGFSLGLERTGGFETVAFCEIEPFPRRVLAKHWPEVPCYEDVRTLTSARLAADGITNINVITGGFPCQDLSTLESSAAWAKAPEADCGPKLSDWLASYDPITSSWRTLQRCFLAQAESQADGLAEFSETWPSAGMMQNGATYRLGFWESLMSESASGLWPTPSKNDGRGFYRLSHRSALLRSSGAVKRQLHWLHRAVLMQSQPGDWTANPRFSLALMGFPTWWLDLESCGNAVIPAIPEVLGNFILKSRHGAGSSRQMPDATSARAVSP